MKRVRSLKYFLLIVPAFLGPTRKTVGEVPTDRHPRRLP